MGNGIDTSLIVRYIQIVKNHSNSVRINHKMEPRNIWLM